MIVIALPGVTKVGNGVTLRLSGITIANTCNIGRCKTILKLFNYVLQTDNKHWYLLVTTIVCYSIGGRETLK